MHTTTLHSGSDEGPSWQAAGTAVTVQQFTGAVGPAVPVSTLILETFKLFFTAALLQLVVEQSNRYAVEVLGERASSWEDVADSEILAFLGFTILMALAHYWRRDPIFHLLRLPSG